MKPEPRPGPPLLVAAALISFPFFVMIADVLIAVGQWINDASGRGEILIAVILVTIGVAIMGAMSLVERHDIWGRHPGLAEVGLIGWFEGFCDWSASYRPTTTGARGGSCCPTRCS